MNTLRLLAALLSLPLLGVVQADNLRLPAGAPPAFQSECGACHLAFPPRLLAAEDWRHVMAGLDKHYGDNASLDEPTRRAIEAYLVGNAGKAKKLGSGGMLVPGEAPRLTATAWFKRKHHEVSPAYWRHAEVRGPANCAACHKQAAAGSYREREIVMPGGRRWKD